MTRVYIKANPMAQWRKTLPCKSDPLSLLRPLLPPLGPAAVQPACCFKPAPKPLFLAAAAKPAPAAALQTLVLVS